MEKTTSISIRELAVLSLRDYLRDRMRYTNESIYIIPYLVIVSLTVIDPSDVGIRCADSTTRDRGIFAIQDGHILRRLFHDGGRGCERRVEYLVNWWALYVCVCVCKCVWVEGVQWGIG